MAAESEYGKKLEFLKSRVHYRGLKTEDIHARLYAVDTLLYFEETITFFEEELKTAQNELCLHKDDNFSYQTWCNLAYWDIDEVFIKNAPKQQERECALNWRNNANTIIDSTHLGRIIEFLPNNIEDLNYDANNGKLATQDAINLFAGPYFNSVNLEYAIVQAIKRLSGVLNLLEKELHKPRTIEEYTELGKNLWNGYETFRTVEILSEYEEAKKMHDLTTDWLDDRLKNELSRLSKSEFISILGNNLTNSEKQNSKIWWDLPNTQEADSKILFGVISKYCQKEGCCIDFSNTNTKIGELIYKCRGKITEGDLNAFFRFRFIATRIKADLASAVNVNDEQDEQNSIDSKYIIALRNLDDANDTDGKSLIKFKADWAIPFRLLAEAGRFNHTDYAGGAAFIAQYVSNKKPNADSLSKNTFSGSNSGILYPRWTKPKNIQRDTDWERYLRIAEKFSQFLD